MKQIIAVLLVISLLFPASNLLAQEDHQLEVANWSFDVVAAVKAPTFSDVVHLGALSDGRDWLVVTMIATNTSTEEQEIHSDKVQLQADGERIKQTGDESEGAASELGYRSIGGSIPHDIDAGTVLQVIQVYKVAPDATDFTLVFDGFNGTWEIPITPLVTASAGSPLALLGEEQSDTRVGTPEPQSHWSITTASFRLTLIGAAVAPTFSGPFHLGMLDDGRSWLVVTYQFHNTTADEMELRSELISLLSHGEWIEQAGDETRSVASELGIAAPTFTIQADERTNVVQVFKVAPDAPDHTLHASSRGEWVLNLDPVIQATHGEANAIVPGTAIDLASVEGGDVAQALPTMVPTPTPTPTTEPTPTPLPTMISGLTPTSAPSNQVQDQPGGGITSQEEAYLAAITEDAEELASILNEIGPLFQLVEQDATLFVDSAWQLELSRC